jgi:hypothetical protein
MNNELTIRSWRELMDIFESNSGFQTDIKRFRSNWVYRGVSNAAWRNETSLQHTNMPKIELVEKHLLRRLKMYAPQSSVHDNSMWSWLTLGRHYGLPTRLLDWSFSYYMALHFALSDHTRFDEADAAIWCVDIRAVQDTLPQGPVKNSFDEEGSFTFTMYTLNRFWGTLEELTDQQHPDVLIFFEPPSFDDRIANQFALLSTTRNPRTITSDWLEQHPQLYRKIIIPRELKWEFRDRLDQLNITERITYPGLEGLTRWLRRTYYYRE